MNAGQGRWVLAAVIALAAAASLWVKERTAGSRSTSGAPLGHVPGSVLEAVRLVQYDRAGRVRYRLETPRLVQFFDDGSLEALTPRIQLRSDGAAPLEVHAHRARVTPDRSRIELDGGVDLQRPEAPGGAGFTAHTRRLTVFPRRSHARTRDPVTIRGQGFVIEGVGAELHLADGVLHLRERVRSRFWNPRGRAEAS